MLYPMLLQSVPWAGTKWQETAATIALIAMTGCISAIIVQKLLKYNSAINAARSYAPKIAKAAQESKWGDAISISKEYAEQTHLAAVVFAGLQDWKTYKDRLPEWRVFDHMNQAMQLIVYRLDVDYKRNLPIVDAIGGTAPFIGALGGSAFTFAFGILLALPTIWFATYMRNMTTRLEIEMKNTANEITTYLETHSPIR